MKCTTSQEYKWALGTSPGATDIMNLTSNGQDIVGVNDQLEGILKHNQSYYATITCENGAGLVSNYTDTKGRYSMQTIKVVEIKDYYTLLYNHLFTFAIV